MECPACGGRLSVYNGKAVDSGYKRYRKCPKCFRLFVTLELFQEDLEKKATEIEERKGKKDR